MSGLHEAFDELVADVPVYGDLDRAVEQADRERRRRTGAVVGLVAAAVVLAVLGALAAAVSRNTNTAPPVTPGPSPSPVTPTPTTAKSQSPATWVDTPVAARDGYGWEVPDPLKVSRDPWFAVAADHLERAGAPLQRIESSTFVIDFEQPVEGSIHPTYGRLGLVADGSDLDPMDGCRYLTSRPPTTPGTVSCSEERFAGPGGERARIARWGRPCINYDGSHPPLDCGDYRVAVAVERRDGRIGYVDVEGRGTPDRNPFTPADLAAAAADPRLTLPGTAFEVPSDATVVSVVEDHFAGYRADVPTGVPGHPGYGQTYGDLGRVGLGVQVLPAGRAPTCGRSWLIDCVERRVFGSDDPTTVFVGAWDQEDWADCCPRNSRSDSRVFVHVGPRHTVVVSEFMVVRANEEPLSPALDRRLIDLALDPRLQ